MSDKGKTSLLLLVIFTYVILIRIPQLTSNLLLPDQDECVLGMMANHFIKAESFPVFFYGQHYGLATLEVLFIAIGIKLFGISALAIKLPMLLLYMCAIVFLFLWIKHKSGLAMAFIITLFFVAEPTWLTWAMKARGGYLSALLIGFYLCYSCQKNTLSNRSYIVNAVLMGMLYHFQLLWFLAWMPLFFYYQHKSGWRKLIWSSVIIFITIGLFFLIAQSSNEYWYKPHHHIDFMLDVENCRKRFMLFLSGHFYFGYAYNLKYGVLVAIKILFIVHLVVFGLALFFMLKRKFKTEITIWLVIVLALFFFPVVAFNDSFQFRYWLPFSASFIGLIVVVFNEIKGAQFNYVIYSLVFTLAFFGYRAGKDIAAMDIYSDWFEEHNHNREKEIKTLVIELQKLNKMYLLCNDINLMWILNYYANDDVLTRWRINHDRHDTQVQEVNAFYRKNKKIDLIGSKFSFKDWKKDSVELKVKWIGTNYYLIENLDSTRLEEHGFKF